LKESTGRESNHKVVAAPDGRIGGATLGAWTTAGVVIAISLLSTFTLSKSNTTTQVTSGASPGGGGQYVDGTDEASIGPQDPGAATDLGTDTGTAVGGTGTHLRSSGGTSSGGTTSGAGAPSGAATGRAGSVASGTGTKVGTAGPTTGGGSTSNADCSKGQNAGESDVGVTARSINFAATVVKTGVARSFLAEAQYGMEAVRVKVNKAGGVCGRLINIKYDDDGWDSGTGQRIIEKDIGEKKYFGLAVNPSSEGLRGAIDNGLIKNSKFPVIGADGMLIDQYEDPWVWPIATSTHSVMHVMAKDAIGRTAKTFGIVWEGNYRFGVEGHDAFVGYVKRNGGNIVADTKVQGGQTAYRNDVNGFVGSCGAKLDKCDFIAVLLEPATAAQWVRDGGLGNGSDRPRVGIGGPQPLFLNSFARDCAKYCANMRVWTSFKPPLPPFNSEPAVATYKNDLAAVSASADANNPHVEGAYAGMQLLVKALQQVGAAPTRDAVKAALDSMTLDTGLGPQLHFSAGNHFASVGAQSFEAIYNGDSFVNWRYTQSGFINDPDVDKDQ
jgi:ABC-type branched-subunit amino acid transport system substrate-binding protein